MCIQNLFIAIFCEDHFRLLSDRSHRQERGEQPCQPGIQTGHFGGDPSHLKGDYLMIVELNGPIKV